MSRVRAEPTWADVLVDYAADMDTAERLIRQLIAAQVASLAFCRLLERWNRGDAAPSTAGGRQAALRRAADRAETALVGLEGPLGRYLLELEPERAEGRSWYGAPSAAELLEWAPVLNRAGVRSSPVRVAQAYLELAVFLRALAGLGDAARIRSAPDRSSLWAGLFDLRENLLGHAVDDLRALATA
jgi:hypothetical protein